MTPLTPAQQALAADPEAVRYAVGIARRFAKVMRREHLEDEFVSAAYVAVVLAARGYDPARGVSFVKAYMPRVLVHELLNVNNLWQPRGYMQRPEGRPKVMNIETFSRAETNSLGQDQGVDINYGGWGGMDQLPAGEDPVGWEIEYEDEVEGLVATLPPAEAEALRRRHLRPGTRVGDVARLLGLSVGGAWRAMDRAYKEAKARAA